MRKIILYLTCCFLGMNIALAEDVVTLTGASRVDWTEQRFTSDITLDTQKAGFKLPANRNAASRRLTIKLPVMVKSPFLSLFVDSSTTLDDSIRSMAVTLEQITDIIESGRRTPDVFARDGVTLKTTNTINLTEISRLLSRQSTPMKPREPIDITPSREYTGIIIDARGKMPVHGEYVRDNVYPCFFPKIWDTGMDSVYEKSMVSLPVAQSQGIVKYDWSDDKSRYEDRVGPDPLFITAEKVFGRNRTDPIISTEDALRILTVPKNRELLSQGKVVILLDKDTLIHDVGIPDRSKSYYALYEKVREYVYDEMTDVEVEDTPSGIRFQVSDLKFQADSSILLQSEYPKIAQIAEQLKTIIASGGYTILVEGHTADVGKPTGQQNLSVERARAVMQQLVQYGIPESIFTYVGYGGTRPQATNDTAEGRAQNRRVDITARPQSIYRQTQ